MRVDIISLFPEMFAPLMGSGITGRACSRGLVKVGLWNPRDYTHDRHRTVDDRSYGGGPGMLMKVQPLRDTLHDARQQAGSRGWTVYLSPQGRPLDQARVKQLARL
ncbi:MAG: tRNA (guanosine(37)-N1)-methyltransferase TrmD, partial [Candidatus Competibacteraceae bacterium]|nr:tRNA (guanosine(37)-N1)-methyltransferase TrmD [Candidatus Competibacteraceae bacterium]